MNFEELQKIWSEQPAAQERSLAEDGELLKRIRDDADCFERTYLNKDRFDIFVVLLVSLGMAGISLLKSSPLLVLSALVYLPMPAYVLASRLRNPLIRMRAHDTLNEVITRALARLHYRCRMIKASVWLGCGSLWISQILSQLHYHLYRPSPDLTRHSVLDAAYLCSVSLLLFVVSRRIIRTKIAPQIADLEKQQRMLSPQAGVSE